MFTQNENAATARLSKIDSYSVPLEMLAGHSVGTKEIARCWRSADVISVRQLTGGWGSCHVLTVQAFISVHTGFHFGAVSKQSV